MDTFSPYHHRRLRLGARHPRTLFVIPSGSVARRSHSVSHPHHTAADFTYLTGLEASDHLLVVIGERSFLLGREERDPLWGEDIVPAPEALAGLERRDLGDLRELLEAHRAEFDRLALPLGRDAGLERCALDFIAYSRNRARTRSTMPLLGDSSLLVGRLRLIKEPSEVECLREANRRTSRVHQRAREMDFVGCTEKEVAAWFEAQFKLEGMSWTAYQTIVGSGARSTVLHARPSDRVINEGDLILIDAGGEWRGYCADVTRVLPAGGEFTRAQNEIYSLVLRAQEEVLCAVRPGTTLPEIHRQAQAVLADGLSALGFERAGELLPEFFPHATSHWLGLDVHDPCPQLEDDGSEVRLAPGMCLTIEPGLYFRSPELSGGYANIGVRIEDNVVVTETGCENLTEAPKDFN